MKMHDMLDARKEEKSAIFVCVFFYFSSKDL